MNQRKTRLDYPFRDALEARGVMTEDSRLFDHPGSMYVGPKIRIRCCEMIFSIPEPGLMLLNLYRRLEAPTGALDNPFGDLLWFLLLVTEPRFDLSRIMGYVDTSEYAGEGGLNDHRLTLFYQRFFKARHTLYDGGTWYYRDVDDRLRALLSRYAHKASRIPATARPSASTTRGPGNARSSFPQVESAGCIE